jgi:hypothetical protein
MSQPSKAEAASSRQRVGRFDRILQVGDGSERTLLAQSCSVRDGMGDGAEVREGRGGSGAKRIGPGTSGVVY